MTLMILLITISFAVQRLGVMQAYEDTNHLQIEDKNMNSVRVLPQAESKFNFAFGFANKKSTTTSDNHGYLEVKVSHYKWKTTTEGFIGEFLPIKFRKCTVDDL